MIRRKPPANKKAEPTTSDDNKSSKDRLTPFLATVHHVSSRHIPGCEGLSAQYDEYRSLGSAKDVDINAMRQDLRRSMMPWLRASNENTIVETVRGLPPAARAYLHSLMPRKFRLFFESDFRGLPNDFAAPTPFLVMRNRDGKQMEFDNHPVRWFPLDKPIVLKYGGISLKIMGTALEARDRKVTFALLLLMRKKKCEFTRKYIYFRTSHFELAKTMLSSNPRQSDIHKANWGSLQRLRGCVIELTNKKGLRTLGGILDGAQELEEDSNLEIGIYFDRNFVELIDEGYLHSNPQIVFKSTVKEANLYDYLMRQKTFNTRGFLKPAHGIRKVYNAAGLGGLHPEKRTMSQIRRTLNKTLVELQKKWDGLIGTFSIKNDKLEIRSVDAKPYRKQQQPPPLKPIKEMEEEYKSRPKVCPHGHRFGIDYEEFRECGENADDFGECDMWEECADAFDAWQAEQGKQKEA